MFLIKVNLLLTNLDVSLVYHILPGNLRFLSTNTKQQKQSVTNVLGLAVVNVLGLAVANVLELAVANVLGLAVANVLGLAVANVLPFI